VEPKFNVKFLEEATGFLVSLDDKSREKIIYNIYKARVVIDKELFKKLSGETWEFRTLHKKSIIGFLRSGTRPTKRNLL
jgi:hypothetical protein